MIFNPLLFHHHYSPAPEGRSSSRGEGLQDGGPRWLPRRGLRRHEALLEPERLRTANVPYAEREAAKH